MSYKHFLIAEASDQMTLLKDLLEELEDSHKAFIVADHALRVYLLEDLKNVTQKIRKALTDHYNRCGQIKQKL